MTQKERIIVSVYTGVLMCDMDQLHSYIDTIMGRPIWTHELANPDVWNEIKEKAKADFLKLCDPYDETTVYIERLDRAENCIARIEDALDRGADNDWARRIIEEYWNPPDTESDS